MSEANPHPMNEVEKILRASIITDEEYEAIIEELANRVIDFRAISLPTKLRREFPKGEIEHRLNRGGSDHFVISHTVDLVDGNLVEILGRIRRTRGRGNVH